MEQVAQQLNGVVPDRIICENLAESFSTSRSGADKIKILPDQVKNWFYNRWCSNHRANNIMGSQATNDIPPLCEDKQYADGSTHIDQYPTTGHGGRSSGKNYVEDSEIDFEAKSSKNGAWYDVDVFLGHRYIESSHPEVNVHFSGLGTEEDEWVNIHQSVRQRSLPCAGAECVAVLSGDLVLCLKEDQEQALRFDARVLGVQKRTHDIRGCRCRFHVRYEHDQTEEIVSLRKVFRRPATNYRLYAFCHRNKQCLVLLKVFDNYSHIPICLSCSLTCFRNLEPIFSDHWGCTYGLISVL